MELESEVCLMLQAPIGSLRTATWAAPIGDLELPGMLCEPGGAPLWAVVATPEDTTRSDADDALVEALTAARIATYRIELPMPGRRDQVDVVLAAADALRRSTFVGERPVCLAGT